MEKNKKQPGLTAIMGTLVIASALIWGLVIIGTSIALKGTECYDKIQNYLVGGVVMHMILIGGMFPLIKKLKNEKKEE